MKAENVMYRGMWVHPWDVADAGPERVTERLASLGLNAASLAVRYIEERQDVPGPGVIFQNPRRRAYVSEEGVVFWSVDPARYAHLPEPLRPVGSRDVPEDVVGAFVKACRGAGLKSVLWLPVLRWGSAVRAAPEYGVVDAYGSPVGHKRLFLCPSRPEVRDALRCLVEELAQRYEFDELELDFIRYPEVATQYGTPLLALAQSPCFCPSCQEEAARQDLDLEEVGRRLCAVVEWHVRYLGRSGYFRDEDFLEAAYSEWARTLAEDELVRRWLRFRAERIRALAEELATVVRRLRPGAQVTADLYPPSGAWLLGQDFKELSGVLDGAKIMVYVRPFRRSLGRIPYETLLARDRIGGKTLVLGLASWPPTTPEDIRRQLELARGCPIDGVSFYCYGWTPDENLEAIRTLWSGGEQ